MRSWKLAGWVMTGFLAASLLAVAAGGRGGPRPGVPAGHGAGARARVGQPGPAAPGERGRARYGHQPAHGPQALERNEQLRQRVAELLPPGSDPVVAAEGFRNLGQFIATAHVAHNLGLPFDQLKEEVLRQGSLGKALQTLKPELPARECRRLVQQAQHQARETLRLGHD